MAAKADPKEAERKQAVDRYNNVKNFFLKKEVIEQLNAVIPKVANADRLLRIALGVLRQNEQLLKCSQASILAGIVQSLQMGLSLDPGLKEAHLVPFWNDKKKMYEAVFIPDYRGYLSLARRGGEVASVSAHPVYKSDHFVIRYGTDKVLEHIPNEDRPDEDPIKGAYCIYYFKDGGVEFDYMPWKDIQKRMNVSKAKASGPWKEWVEEMAVKTVIRHSIKQVGISSDLARAAELENRVDSGEGQFDLLPPIDLIPVEGGEGAPLTLAAPSYDELVGKAISQEEKPYWLKFVEETAINNKKTVEETKERLAADFPKALQIFEAWKAKTPKPEGADKKTAEKQPPTQPPEEGKKKEGAPGDLFNGKNGPSTPQTNAPPPAADAVGNPVTVLCPNTQDQRTLDFCKTKCPYTQGCPAYEGATEIA